MLCTRKAIVATLVWFAGSIVSVAGAQTVIHVDDDAPASGDGLSWDTAYNLLDTALAAAHSGDQIWVAAGRYVGNFTLVRGVEVYGGFAGAETELTQRDWTANPTILDGNQTGSVVTSPPGATETTRIDGFTITNGNASYGGGLYLDLYSPTIVNNTIMGNSASDGGGLFMRNSSATIANNTIMGNIAYSYGGGLYLRDSSPTIENNTITDNSASRGGGLYLRGSSATIANNTITGNGAYSGGGLYLIYSSPTVANNNITGNGADSGGGLYLARSMATIAGNAITGNSAAYFGAGLYVESSSPTVANKTIAANSADWDGGGLYLWDSSPTVMNNAIAGNDALIGGGLYLWNSSPTLANNTITGNGAFEGGGLYLGYSSPTIANTIMTFNSSGIYRHDKAGTPTLRHNCVHGNTTYDYSGLANPTGTDGNISTDPLFVETPNAGPDGEWGTHDDYLGDLHLSSGSPSIDAGDNTAVPIDILTDLDGRLRFVNDPAVPDTGYGTRPIVDMGAYERQAVLLDIHPGRCPNRLNIRSNARVKMAVVGTDAFDVTQIDTGSLVLERAGGLGGGLVAWDHGHGNAISVTDAATPFHGDLCDCHRRRRDGIDDLVLSFRTRDMVRELELCGIGPKTPVMLTVRGQLLDGTPFDASDCILTIGGRPRRRVRSHSESTMETDRSSADPTFDFSADRSNTTSSAITRRVLYMGRSCAVPKVVSNRQHRKRPQTPLTTPWTKPDEKRDYETNPSESVTGSPAP